MVLQKLLVIAGAPLPLFGWSAAGLIVPTIALATSFVGLYARFVRSSLLVALAAPYTTTARAKGLPERRVVLRHALRNSLALYVSAVLLEFGSVFGAAMVVDYIFKLGGIGELFIRLIGSQSIDPSAVQLVIVVTAAIVLATSLLADLAVIWLDPRVRPR
jgi:ABC-type dipeptide/oligopeptide/nickel transport system permease component